MVQFTFICGNPILAVVIIVGGFFLLGYIIDPEGMEIFFNSFKEDDK